MNIQLLSILLIENSTQKLHASTALCKLVKFCKQNFVLASSISLCLERSTHLFTCFLLVLLAIPTSKTFLECFCISHNIIFSPFERKMYVLWDNN